jgi:hypothetical protein
MLVGMTVGALLCLLFDRPLTFGIGWGMGVGSTAGLALNSARPMRERRVTATASLLFLVLGAWIFLQTTR